MSAERIAGICFNNGTVGVDFKNRFMWSASTLMPFYNDTRKLLCNYACRLIIKEGLEKLVREKNISYDLVAGIPTGGISHASMISKKVVVGDYLLDHSWNPQIFNCVEHYDLVAATVPFSIFSGTRLANHLRKPMVYVRVEKKKHGLKKSIEGVFHEGQNVVLVDHYFDNSYLFDAVRTLEAEGLSVDKSYSMNMSEYWKKTDFDCKNILLVEDVVSTGRSTVLEAENYVNKGARIAGIISLFNYGFRETNKYFERKKLRHYSLLCFEDLVKYGNEKGFINDSDFEKLMNWKKGVDSE